MTNSKQTRKALYSSVLSLLLCFVMLIGTTFAWFTDTASTSVNKIQAGTLDIQLLDANGASLEGETLAWQKAEAGKNQEILWEPGATYSLQPVTIKNNGNLALKYKVAITGIKGDAKLNEAIDWTIKIGNDDYSTTDEISLAAGNTNTLTISGTMKTTAGNQYQGLSIEGVSITVYATQDTVEYDSTTDQYDKGATYAETVATETELEEVLADGGSIVLLKDLGLATTDHTDSTTKHNFDVITKDVDIDLDGHTLTLDQANKLILRVEDANVTISNGTIIGYGNNAFEASDGANVTLNNCIIKNTEGHGVYSQKKTTAGAGSGVAPVLILNNCTIEAKEYCVAVMNGGNAVINGGSYTSYDNCVIGTNGSNAYAGNKITINGGTFNGSIVTSGYIACGIYMAHAGDVITVNGGTFNITDGVGLFARNGAATVSDSVVWNISESTRIGQIGDVSSVTAGTAYAFEDGTINGKSSN